MSRVNLRQLKELKNRLGADRLKQVLAASNPEQITQLLTGQVSSIDLDDQLLSEPQLLESPESPTGFAGDLNTLVSDTVTAIDAEDSSDGILEGLKVGMFQDDAMQSAADDLNADLESNGVQTGIRLAQAIKFGGEAAITNAILGLSGGTAAPFLAARAGALAAGKGKKVVDTLRGIEKFFKARGMTGRPASVALGAAVAGGANYTSNEIAQLMGIIGGEGKITSSTLEKNEQSNRNEAAITGAIGGVAGAFVGPRMTREANTIGIKGLAADVDAFVAERADEIQKVLNSEGNPAQKIFSRMASDRLSKVMPVKKTLDLFENGKFIENPSKIDVEKLDSGLFSFAQKLKEGKIQMPDELEGFVNALIPDKAAQKSIKTSFNKAGDSLTGDKILDLNTLKQPVKKSDNVILSGGNKKDLITGKNLLPELNEQDIFRMRKNMLHVLEEGLTNQKAGYTEAAGFIKQNNLVDKVTRPLPTEYKRAVKKLDVIKKQYANPDDPELRKLNSLFEDFENSGVVPSEEAITSLLVSDKQSKISEAVGKFADDGIVDKSDVIQVFDKEAAKKAQIANMPRFSSTGSAERGSRLLEGATDTLNVTEEASAAIKNQNTPIQLLKNRIEGKPFFDLIDSVTSKADRVPDPQIFGQSLLKNEKSLRRALGKTGRDLADAKISEASTLKGTKELFQERTGLSGQSDLFQRVAGSADEGAGTQPLASQIKAKGAQDSLLVLKLGQLLGPTVLRQGPQWAAQAYLPGTNSFIAGD